MVLILIAVGVLGGLSLLLAGILAFANRKLAVFEDPRIDAVEDMLPHANCGACGFPGCRPFAEALVGGQTKPAKCTVSSEEGRVRIASFLGVDAGASVKRVARLACAGGINVSRHKAIYEGHSSCRGASLVSGGGKACVWGCLGLGDCERVCDFNALHLNEYHLPVVNEQLCTACNACVEACPKDLFSLQPIDRRLWVACKSLASGDAVLEGCEVGCTGCARCAADAPEKLISMHQNLPVVDYGRPHQTLTPIQRCPTGAIVWLDPEKGPVRGEAAPVIARTQPLGSIERNQ